MCFEGEKRARCCLKAYFSTDLVKLLQEEKILVGLSLFYSFLFVIFGGFYCVFNFFRVHSRANSAIRCSAHISPGHNSVRVSQVRSRCSLAIKKTVVMHHLY